MSKTHICLLSFIMGAGLLLNSVSVSAQLKAELDSPAVIKTPLITDIPARKSFSLNGKWQYIVDPYETGFYDYRWKERRENDREAYWNSDVPENATGLLYIISPIPVELPKNMLTMLKHAGV